MAAHVTPFASGDIQLSETIMIDGIPHATRRALGEWLEYDDPAEGIRKLLNRNSYIEAHGIPVNLTGMGGAREYETIVYHPIGFLLIVMESGQPKAIEMKQAVAEFVYQHAGPHKLSFREKDALQRRRIALLERLGRTADAFVQAALLADLRDVNLSLGVSVPDVALLGTDAKQLTLKWR